SKLGAPTLRLRRKKARQPSATPRPSVHLPERGVSMKHSARVLAIAAAITGITACTRSEKPPPQAGQPLDPLTTASRMVAMPIASALGDEDAAKAHFDAAHADLLRSMKVADSRRPIDREAA